MDGMSYEELGDLGYCRKVEHCGPLSTFLKLRQRWADGRRITPSIRTWRDGRLVTAEEQEEWTVDEKVAQKVKDFYFCARILASSLLLKTLLEACANVHLTPFGCPQTTR